MPTTKFLKTRPSTITRQLLANRRPTPIGPTPLKQRSQRECDIFEAEEWLAELPEEPFTKTTEDLCSLLSVSMQSLIKGSRYFGTEWWKQKPLTKVKK